MPNLLKSLPREILDDEDSKFIYNVLNPLLFEKIKESDVDTTVTHTVSSLLNKDINLKGKFLPEFTFPYNLNSREFHVYMTDGQQNIKLEYFGKVELIKELDDLKDYIFFYFGMEGYSFIQDLIRKYYYISNELDKNKKLYEDNLKKYQDTRELRKRKVYKSTYEYFKGLFDEYQQLKTEFDIILVETANYGDYSINQLVDNFARELGFNLNIKTFDNEIIFESCKLFSYLNTDAYGNTANKHVFSGKTILSTTTHTFKNTFELIAIFAMEISTVKEKYDRYLKLLVESGNGYAMDRSEYKKLRNPVQSGVSLNLNSDNLTYFLNEEKNELEIYLYFLKDFRIDESTIELKVNHEVIPASIHSVTGSVGYGYTILEYFDDTTKYYKITIHDYLIYSLEDTYINYDINSIDIKFDIIQGLYKWSDDPLDLTVDSNKFLDNFAIYGKNETTGFFERLSIPYKVIITIDEQEDKYVRVYEVRAINSSSQQQLMNQTELFISCYEYDYVYEPKIYVDFFKHMNDVVKFRYNTITPYVLVDDILGKEIEFSYYTEVPRGSYSTNISKNVVMADGNTYRKLYDEVDHLILMNPYNESNYEFVSKINYQQYMDKNHVNQELVFAMVDKIPFRDNLRFLDKVQVDTSRNVLIFMYRGKQMSVPMNEGLKRGKNFENLVYTTGGMIEYYGIEMREDPFIYTKDGIFLKNPKTHQYDLIEASPTEQINLTTKEREIFFDMFEMAHCVILDQKKYKVDGLYIDSYTQAQKMQSNVMYVESKYGIPRYKDKAGNIVDVDFSKPIVDGIPTTYGSIGYDKTSSVLMFKYSDTEVYSMHLTKVDIKPAKHRQLGMTSFSIFYAGNVLPENTNKTFMGRENIYNSMFMSDNIYKLGRHGDVFNDTTQHKLLAEQLNLDAMDASKYNVEQEPYLMFKSTTASFKGLESYLRSSLKSISTDIGVSPVYMVQRNRFISEWARVSGVLPSNHYAIPALKDLVADLMETKLMTHSYDDLMDIFKNNDYEKFSLDTNNIHSILVQYILRYLEDEHLLEHFAYYLIHEVWIANNRKKIVDFIKNHASDKIVKEISTMTFFEESEKVKLFHTFTDELSKVKKQTIHSYLPLGNYSDWQLYVENNKVKFHKPFIYEIIDISEFITMPVEWNQPLYMIRPVVDDGLYVKRDFRFLDLSIATNSQITFDDAYNEYVENIKNKINRPVDYLFETLKVLNELSITQGFDLMGINLVIIKWIVERHMPTFMTTNHVKDIESFKEGIIAELTSAEHPNMIVSYNKIKESTLLGDLGTSVQTIYDSIIQAKLVTNTVIRLDVTSSTDLEYLDKIKRPLEHYFDYLFFVNRHDIITKILALFTEDVIATSLIDLSFAINVKNSKGDATFDIYERMIMEIFDDFLPFHSLLDKIIFTIKVMETASVEAVGKQLDAVISDKTMIDIMMDFAEKVKINTFDTLYTIITRTNIYSSGLLLCGGHDEIPYDYDRTVRVGGHDIPSHMDDFEHFGMDDEWYVINRDNWRHRVADIMMPPAYADLIWNCGTPPNEFEQVAETNITDYYHIKTKFFERDDRIESYFVDSIPVIDINQGVGENPDISVTEDYLISIESTYKIKFYDMELLGHDEYGLDETWGPDDQSTLIGMKESIRQDVMHDFYDRINISVMDSIWSDIVIIYNLLDVPGHDEFAIDENYHQSSPERLDQELSVMVYDELLVTGFNIKHTDMSDISLVDKSLATQVASDFNELMMGVVVSDVFHVTVNIIANRNFDGEGHFIRPAHDEFVYDEYYHNSADESRVDNMADILMSDFMGDVRIDFGFMRMLPFDPYVDLIKQKFYRANLPGSDLQSSRIRDKFSTNIRASYKDIIRVGLMDFYTLDMISDDVRRKIYEDIERDNFGGDIFTSSISDSLIRRNIHHDFRENIIAIDKYARIITDTDILSIYGTRAAQFERDELFKLTLGDKVYSNIKVKHSVDRIRTKIDRDYLRSIKVEEENFVEFKYMDDNIRVRFEDTMRSFYSFNERSSISLNELEKTVLTQFNKEKSDITVLDRVHYGNRHEFEIDGMMIGISDKLLEVWSNKIHHDSMIISVTDDVDFKTDVFEDRNFDLRILQPHAEFGHMGYTEESLDRSIDSRLTDSLIQISKDSSFDKTTAKIYDGMMHDLRNHITDYIDVVISESLKTYVEIVKKPWVMAEYDNFGHNELPHVYSGEDDEFDITTQLSDAMRMDAYANLYETNALIEMYDRIFVGYHHSYNDEILSVSMKDDLKVMSIGFKESMKISPNDVTTIRRKFIENPTHIGVQDTIWYGYKLRDEVFNVTSRETMYYGYTDETRQQKDRLHPTMRDWLVYKYIFIDDKPNIHISDRITYSGVGTSPKDNLNVTIKEKFTPHEYIDNVMQPDNVRAVIIDKLFIGSTGRTYNEKIIARGSLDEYGHVGVKEKLKYGPGKKFTEPLMVFADNRWEIGEHHLDSIPNIDVEIADWFEVGITTATFKDSLTVSPYERMKFGPVFRDKTHITGLDYLNVKYSWMDRRYGVDVFPHSENEMEYYDNSADRQITAAAYENIKIIDVHMTFGESLTILSSDQLWTSDSNPTTSTKLKGDGIVVSSNDNLMYGIGLYDYIWDAKEWDSYGYTVPYESWRGHIPHDDFPYDEMAHSEQGNDLSQVNTGITENLFYGFDFVFKDTLNVHTSDKNGFSTWEYKSVFKDNMYIHLENKVDTRYYDSTYPQIDVALRNEFMTVSYEFADKIKTHKFLAYNNGISTEEINTYDIETHQLLETIMKYRMYENIDATVNEDLLSSALFKYDDELSLVTDYETKINLYKAQSDGSLTRSMTIIQDKSTAKIELLFNDGVMAVLKDRVQGTEAFRPNEYLE